MNLKILPQILRCSILNYFLNSQILTWRRNYSKYMAEEKLIDSCECKCHLGGAVSCPSCRDTHEKQHCEHCS